MDKIFLIACFLIPFENFFFAPSAGWAAVAPIIFAFYIFFNYNKALQYLGKSLYILVWVFWGCFSLVINSLFYDFHINGFMQTMFSVVLGISCYLSFRIYLDVHRGMVDKVVDVLCIAYYISILVGFIEFIAIRLNIISLQNIIMFLNKRDYLYVGRVQFAFTEPSFLSMHLFGLLLPLYLITKKKKIIRLIVIYVICAVVFNSSVRFLIDILAVLVIFLFFKLNIKKLKTWIIVILGAGALMLSMSYIYQTNSRIKGIVDRGVYADGSLAVRVFRMQAVANGMMASPLQNIIGYGFSNSYLAVKNGFDKTYDKAYEQSGGIVDANTEIMAQRAKDFYDDNCGGNLYFRIWAENGFLFLVLFIIFLLKINKNTLIDKKILYIVAYTYIQGDSYAFYPLWVYLAFAIYFNNKKLGRRDSLMQYADVENE